MLKNIRTKLSARLPSWHILVVEAPVLLGVLAVFVLGLYARPMPAHTRINSQTAADKKNVIRHVAAAPKAAQPVAAVPKPAPSPPAPPAPAKTPVQAGTPKAEPVVTPSPSSSVSGLTPTTPTPPPSSQASTPPITTGYLSSNWSGYLATNASFTGVSGSWTATLATGNGSSTSADSTWIGIGGVTSGDLIQVGTQNLISAGGQVSTSAFYELLPNFSQPVPGVTVSPGDGITASISQMSGGQWSISITDTTKGQTSAFTVSYASSLSSAEWIEEDPSFSFRRQIPFDNFHQAAFAGGSTVANGVSMNIAASPAQPVTMVNNAGQTIAVPSAIGSDGASFTVNP
jgi:hypothetical protein